MIMISILILTYEQPTALELCLESIVKNQYHKNQILIVENGYCEANKPIFEKYKEYIEILPFEENVGMNRALNLGVCNVKYELVFIGHDDMVYPKHFDLKMLHQYRPGMVLTVNSIEPYPSFFQQFTIKDLGRDPKKSQAIALINIDSEPSESALTALRKTSGMLSVKAIKI